MISIVTKNPNIGKVKGIGIKAQRKYLYSITRKYKNIIKIPEKILIWMYNDKRNTIENKDAIDAEAPNATAKNGIALFILNFIL